jgi:hypothetical protein
MALIKTTGKELKKFWDDNDPAFWPADSEVDSMTWQVNGIEREDVHIDSLADLDVLVVSGAIGIGDDYRDLAGVMRKWRKKQTHVTLVVELPAEQQDALAAFLKGLKGNIVK